MGNEESKFKPGDVLSKDLGIIKHYGVFIGDDRVIDLSPEGIKKRSLEEFANGKDVQVRSFESPQSREKIVKTAEYYLKNKEEWGDYNLVSNNCEHFATYCATGYKSSGQVVKAVIVGVIGVGVAAKIALDLLGNKDKDNDSDDDNTEDGDSDGDALTTLAQGAKLISKLLSD